MSLPRRSFHFIRHGQTHHNVEVRFAGNGVESILTDLGLQQAQKAAEKLAGQGITRIITSPLTRAHTTATLINEVLQLPLEVNEALREQSFGSWENQLYADLCKKHGLNPDSFDYLQKLPPDAESWPVFRNRVEKAFTHLLNLYRDDKLLIVAHGGVFCALHKLLLGRIDECTNAQPYHIHHTSGAWQFSAL